MKNELEEKSSKHSRDNATSVIWIASYPKSGNTWVQSVVRKAGKSYGFIPGVDFDVYKMQNESRSPNVAGGIQPNISNQSTTVLKTHNEFIVDREIHHELGLKTVGFVYVIRNPLDILLSYINFTRLQYRSQKEVRLYQERLFIDLLGFEKVIPYEEWVDMKLEDIPRYHLDHALRVFTENNTEIPSIRITGGSWLNHYLSWYEAGQRLPSVFLKYENLLKGAEQFLSLRKIFTFTESEIISSVNSMNQIQRSEHSSHSKQIFYNKKDSYYYLRFFSGDLIAKFLARFEVELEILGYGRLPKDSF